MTISAAIRDQVRQRYNYRCGYCGTSEINAGGELEIEHFRPKAKGGSDVLENLVYSCARCNRFKAAYWPAPTCPPSQHLLHPLLDNLAEHIDLSINGELLGLTARGWFHINWLQLNRPQLITARRLQQQLAANRQLEKRYQLLITQLQEQNLQQAHTIARLRSLIAQLQKK